MLRISLSYELFQLKNDLDIDFNLQEAKRGEPDYERRIICLSGWNLTACLRTYRSLGARMIPLCGLIFDFGSKSLENTGNNKLE